MVIPDYPEIKDINQERTMKFFYFVSLIASALYLLIFLPKLRTRRTYCLLGMLDLSGS